MAAPRKYNDAQRAEIWRLHEAGHTSEEISDICRDGTAAVERFEIPRRSVSDIVARIAQENRISVPENAGDVDGLQTVLRFPGRIARIFNAEIERLATRQRRGQLTVKDLELLRKATEISAPLSKRLEGALKQGHANSVGTGKNHAKPRRVESVLERLAREESDEKQGEDRVGATHTHQPTTTARSAGGPSPSESVMTNGPEPAF